MSPWAQIQQRQPRKHNLGANSQIKRLQTTWKYSKHPHSLLPGESCNVATCHGLQDSAKAKYFGFICPSCSARTCLWVLTFPSLPAEQCVGIGVGNKNWTPTCDQGVCGVKIMDERTAQQLDHLPKWYQIQSCKFIYFQHQNRKVDSFSFKST